MNRVDTLAGVVAFLQRAFGIHRRPTFGKDIDRRAAAFLAALDPSRPLFWRRVALHHLRFETDLVGCEAANEPSALRLQALLFEMNEAIGALGFEGFNPVRKLIAAVLVQAKTDAASEVRFDLSCVDIWFLIGHEWTHAMWCPTKLANPIRGHLKLLESLGKKALLTTLDVPEVTGFVWSGNDDVIVKLGNTAASA